MGAINGRVIYSPKGKAGEYAENAANFYVGCSNGCTYCYLRKGRGAKVLGGNTPELKKALREYPYALDIFTNELLKHKDGRRCCRYHLRANPKRPANWIYQLPGTERRKRKRTR